MKLESLNHVLGIATKSLALALLLAFSPAIVNEAKWISWNKKRECATLDKQYLELLVSIAGLNQRAFQPGEGSAINQAFLGTVLASATQAPNAKLVQAAVYGCPTVNYPLQKTSW